MNKLSIIFFLFLFSCGGIPENVKPVDNFKIEKYLGKWYEIARLDHSFERGLERVTAEYSFRKDGGITVKNRGFSNKNGKWKEALGKAFFTGKSNEGYFKVSFFGPFYGAYVIFELDKKNYQYAFVSGPSTSYLWFLSRTPTVSDKLKAEFETTSKELGFSTQDLIWVNQE